MMDDLNRLRMVVYVADKRITDEAPDSIRYFCDVLFDYKYDTHISFSKHKILDALNFHFTNNSSIDPCKKVNDVLERCELRGLTILENELPRLDINSSDRADAVFFTNDVNRKRTFRKISNKVFWRYHYLGHFLILQQHLRDIYEKHEATSDRVYAILLKWYQSTSVETRTWQHLNAVLRFLEVQVNTGELIEESKKEEKMKFYNSEQKDPVEASVPYATKTFQAVYLKECAQNVDYNELTCLEALNIVARMIGDDWVRLSDRLNMKKNIHIEGSDEEVMKKCFEDAQLKIIWKDLKYHLKTMNRIDIIEEIKRNTCITDGLESNSKMLKERYQKTLKNWSTPAAFKDYTGKKCMTETRREAFVNVMVGEWDETHSSDREHFLRSFTRSKTDIQMKDIVQPDDQIILIRGIAGIGKTSFVDSLVINWANEEMLTHVDFLFKYTCRELNSTKNINNWQDLITKKLSMCYDGMLNDLNDISDRILLIIDGLDEYKHLKELTDTREQNNLASAFYDVLGSSALCNKKMMLCGRPQSCDTMRQILLAHDSVISEDMLKLVEITGFDDSTIETYVDQFFHKSVIQSERLKNALYDMDILKAMAHIPIYLYILCNVFASEEKLEDFNTITKLNIAACLVFLRDHMAEFKGQNTPLSKLCKNESVIQMIRVTAKFAHKSLVERNIVFEEDEFEDINCLKSIESSGIIEKFEGDEEGDVYQFTHLAMQEFLSAVHIFIMKLDVWEWKRLGGCAPIVAGLCGISEKWHQGPKYLKTFVDALCETKHGEYIKTLIEHFSWDKSLFLTMHYEYQGHFSKDESLFLYKHYEYLGSSFCMEYSPKQLYQITYHHTLNHLIYFLRHYDAKVVELKIKIKMNDGHLHSGELRSLSSLLHLFPVFNLEVTNTSVTVDGLHSLSQEIKKHGDSSSKIFTLFMTNCNLNNGHFKELQEGIPFLKKLDLRGNTDITEQSMKYICNSIVEASETNCNLLEELNLSGCKLNVGHIKELHKCIPFLKKLHLSLNSDMTEQSMKCISNSIVEARGLNCNLLEELDLSYCKLNDGHIKELHKCLPFLKKLDLFGNSDMTAQSMKYMTNSIVEASGLNCNLLEELDLRYCKMKSDDIEELHKCIPFLEI